MKLILFQEAINRILQVNFFSKCGDLSLCKKNSVYKCVNKNIAEKIGLSEEWEYYTQEQAGELTAFLYKKNAKDLGEFWNNYVQRFDEVWKSDIKKKVLLDIGISNFSENLLPTIQWDLLHFTMRNCYTKYNPPSFYQDLFYVYESGHYPCGVKDFSNFKSPIILVY